MRLEPMMLAPRAHLRMFVGEFAPGSPATVTLKAYDANNNLVGQARAALTPSSGFHTPLTLDSAAANISRFVIAAPNEVGVDDFVFS